MDILDRETLDMNFHLHFLVDLSRYYGFAPEPVPNGSRMHFDLREGEFTDLPPEHQDYLSPSLSDPLNELLKNRGSKDLSTISDPAIRRKLLHTLLRFYNHHLEGMKPVRSLKVLEETFD